MLGARGMCGPASRPRALANSGLESALAPQGCSSDHFREAVPTFTLAFLVENTRDLDPPIEFAGTRLAPLEIQSEEARNRLNEELGPARTKLLAENGGKLPVVLVQVDDADEQAALAAAYRQGENHN
jgi:hypothetical protein